MIRRVGQTSALFILAVLLIAQGLLVMGQGPTPIVSAQAAADACTDGYALWAHSDSSLTLFEWSGSGSNVQGKVRSHNTILLSGSNTVIGNTVEYASSLIDSGDNNQYPPAVQVAPSDMPVTFDITAYQPGGSAATAAQQAGRYYYIAGDLRIGGGDDDDNPELRDGLYYVGGDVELSDGNLRAQVTIVAQGDIEISSSGHELSAYTGGLVLFSSQTRSWGEPIKISGGESSYRGIVYAPGGRIEVSGSDNQFHGGLFARTLKLNGSALTVTVDNNACATDVPTATPPPTSTPGPTPTATNTRPPGSLTNLVYLPSLLYRLANPTGEPNNECSQAHSIAPGVTHTFLAEDLHDWYTFVLPTPGDLTVRVGNFGPVAGQLAAFRGESCSGPVFLQNYGDDGLEKVLALGAQPAGRYFLYISNDGVPNNTDPYTLLIDVR